MGRRVDLVVLIAVLVLSLLVTRAHAARADTIQAPIGGKALPLGEARVACGSAGGWTVEAEGKLVRPPTGDESIGVATDLKTAPSVALCATSTTLVTLLATGRWPTIDAVGATLSLDEGRLEVKGKRLAGVRFEWSSLKATGADTCNEAKSDAAVETCGVLVSRDLPAISTSIAIRWTPRGGRADATSYDAEGKRANADAFAIPVTRVILGRLLSADASVDVTTGSAKLAVAHLDALAGVDCVGATCELGVAGLVVQNVTTSGDKLTVKTRLIPHVFYRKGDTLETTPTLTVSLLHCPMTVVSGPPLAGVDDACTIVRLDGACASSAASLRFQIAGAPSAIVRTIKEPTAAYVVIRVGRLGIDPIVIQALRPLPDGSIVASAGTPTVVAPRPHAILELKDIGTIDFIPINRAALVQIPPIEHGRLVLLPVEGAYAVAGAGTVTTVRGVGKAAGFVSLRYAVRGSNLPAALAEEDLGTLVDPLSFALREANVPAPIGASALGKNPIVELICDLPERGPTPIEAGEITHVPFAARDSCRFVFHRDRVPVEDGAQKLTLEIDVTRVDGAARPESHVREDFVLRPGTEERLAWIKGIGGEFDRVTVRLSHSIDEAHYVTTDLDTGAPAAQWSMVMGTGKARIYATTAIPTGLYRVSDRAHSGILALNFGVLSRLTWLDSEGHEGVLGLETGVMGVGLARDTSSTGESLTQVAVVAGIGLSVPIANRSLATETSVNLHAWCEYEVSRDWGRLPGNPFAFVFGPSISIGNVGTNL